MWPFKKKVTAAKIFHKHLCDRKVDVRIMSKKIENLEGQVQALAKHLNVFIRHEEGWKIQQRGGGLQTAVTTDCEAES